jgi:hypothetical protein
MMVAGEVVADGTDFRNVAHFRYKADILVRPFPSPRLDWY